MKKQSTVTDTNLNDDFVKIISGEHHDPFTILGRHVEQDNTIVRVFSPLAEHIMIGPKGPEMQRIPGTDLFECLVPMALPEHYELFWIDKKGHNRQNFDPYDFQPQIPTFDQYLFAEGKHWNLYEKLGAHCKTIDDITGVLFSVWAPNAKRVSVIGDFNQWDGRCHTMRSLGNSGIWEIFIPGLEIGHFYKFEIVNPYCKNVLVKTDPYGQAFEYRPRTASIIVQEKNYQWNDLKWMNSRNTFNWLHQPLSIYEVHLGSWRRDHLGNFLNYRELAKQLVEYVLEMGFTHIELLPVTEHPLDASWGYQTTGYFAPTSRHGSPEDFRYFVDYCHQNNIGVLLDWVPAHFPRDNYGLAQFDGTALYEHEDPRQGEHRDWGTLIYNYGRNEVKNFLLASAIFWLEEFHIDGFRVDAVASMLYLDYSREAHDWIPNSHGGNENLEAIDFFRELNSVTHDQFPGTIIIAEESTSWPQVTRPTWTGGLGFSMKWNMGWMHDTLAYMNQEPVYRSHHHDQITFGLSYAFSENFILPLSHDEVVHGKQSLLDKMPGDEWQKFANLRLLYTLMFTYPGKKLLFMGCEFAQPNEWNFNHALDWYVLDNPLHQGIKLLIKDLNKLFCNHLPLYQHDFENKGFEWIDCHDNTQSVISFIRKSDNDFLLGIFNFTPVTRQEYRIGIPMAGTYQEIFNSDSNYYGGSNVGNSQIMSEPTPWMGRTHSIKLTLPPLAGIVLKHGKEPGHTNP